MCPTTIFATDTHHPGGVHHSTENRTGKGEHPNAGHPARPRYGPFQNRENDLTRYRHIRLEPTGEALGAEVKDLDLSAPLSEEPASELRRAHAEFGVLFFHRQSLTCVQHLAAAR